MKSFRAYYCTETSRSGGYILESSRTFEAISNLNQILRELSVNNLNVKVGMGNQ